MHGRQPADCHTVRIATSNQSNGPRSVLSRIKTQLSNLRADHLLTASATLLLNTVLISALGFVFWVVAAHQYTSSSIGVYVAITAGATLLGAVASLGWPLTVIRFLPDDPEKRRLVGIMFGSVLVVGSALVAILELLAGPSLFPALHIPRGAEDAILTLILVVLNAILAVNDAALISQRAASTVLVKNFIGALAKIVALFPLASHGATGLILAATFGTVVAAVLGGFGLLRRLPSSGPSSATDARSGIAAYSIVGDHVSGLASRAMRYVRYSATGYVSMLFGILPSTAVPLIVVAVLGRAQAGRFAMAFLIAGLLSVVPSTASQVLFAEGSRDPQRLRRNTFKAITAIYVLLIPAALTLFFAAPLLMHVLGHQYAVHATTALRVMVAGSVFLGLTYVVDSILTTVDRMRAYFLINAFNSIMVLVLVEVAAGTGLTAIAFAWTAAQGISMLVGLALLGLPMLSGGDPLTRTPVQLRVGDSQAATSDATS